MLRLARALLYVTTALIVLALGLLHARHVGFYDLTGSSRFGWMLTYIGILCLAAYGTGLPDLPRNAYQFMWTGMAAAGAGALGMSLLQLVVGSQLLPRFVVFWSAVLLVPAWALSGFVASGGRKRAVRRDRVAVVANEHDAEALEVDLAKRPERRARIVAVVAPTKAETSLNAVVSGAEATVVALAREALADDAVVEQVASLHEQGVRVRTLALFYDEWLGKLPLSELERVALMFDIGEIHRVRYGRVKRAMDFTLATLFLPVVLVVAPIVAAGNLAFGNPGPLLYRQTRIGRGGSPFTILKFRTMRNGGSLSSWTSDADPRITGFGRVLRKTHLDELPQLVNIMRGDLSLVGPRPEQPHYVEQLAEKIPFYRLRHLVRPGVTGWAQVKYDYGASEHDAMEKLQYEFWYLRHQSLTLDLRIIGRTIRSVISSSGR